LTIVYITEESKNQRLLLFYEQTIVDEYCVDYRIHWVYFWNWKWYSSDFWQRYLL